jgi:acyl carrier protein
LNGKLPEPIKPERVEWQSINDESKLTERVKEGIARSGSLLITGIPDARLRPEIVAMANMATLADRTVADLRSAISQDSDNNSTTGVQPESMYQLAEQLDLQVQTIGTAPGRYNALLTPAGPIADGRILLPARDLTPEQCTNNPMQGRIQRSLVPALKDHLRVSLPEYMVPPVFSILDEFPLTPNGKIDRNALPAPEQGSTQSYTPPRSDTETLLVRIWENLLGLDQVGVLDDFFGLGGHSLLATQLISRMRDELQITLPLNALFDTPTVAGLADAVDTIRWALTSVDESGDDNLEEIEI